MTGPGGNSEFHFPETLSVLRGEPLVFQAVCTCWLFISSIVSFVARGRQTVHFKLSSILSILSLPGISLDPDLTPPPLSPRNQFGRRTLERWVYPGYLASLKGARWTANGLEPRISDEVLFWGLFFIILIYELRICAEGECRWPGYYSGSNREIVINDWPPFLEQQKGWLRPIQTQPDPILRRSVVTGSHSRVAFKADLHGTIFAYDCRMRFLERALLASWKNRIQFPRYKLPVATIVVGFNFKASMFVGFQSIFVSYATIAGK